MWPVTIATFRGTKKIFNVWKSIGEKMLSTFLYSSRERGRVNLILLPELAGDMNYLMKQFPSLCVARNHSYIRRCLTFFNVRMAKIWP